MKKEFSTVKGIKNVNLKESGVGMGWEKEREKEKESMRQSNHNSAYNTSEKSPPNGREEMRRFLL